MFIRLRKSQWKSPKASQYILWAPWMFAQNCVLVHQVAISQDKWPTWPVGGGEGRSKDHQRFMSWAQWICVPNLMSVYPIIVEHFTKNLNYQPHGGTIEEKSPGFIIWGKWTSLMLLLKYPKSHAASMPIHIMNACPNKC